MYATIWKLAGDPDTLAGDYDAMLAEIPTANMRQHLCLCSGEGIVIVDTCPTLEIAEAFAADPGFAALRRRHGLPEPVLLARGPVHAAFTEGRRLPAA